MEVTKIIIKYFTSESDIFIKEEVDNFEELLRCSKKFIEGKKIEEDVLYIKSKENYKVNVVKFIEVKELEIVRKQQIPPYM
ncbi:MULTISPECIES: hypothetical protein [unclassified Clostridioides]|uniref:hypothetical protein n=1 Tax=unclassified Clostridioides TaxID=2635829 RepID=UPI001D1164CC|nr:hypothetical protein [Clostridioides sp. ES-S-0049-03]MCC0655064.1 hypothetical protein [Clostridioides sp. ES-S-0123-01]MCC0673511.1 hypothetical protein [Clostridioides sp. ES-S-0145-01]MCC0675159.1 hypothetical protein [Clostridioides sp. ES-W-0018-02]MCC0679771.1 hypothetical protein [Clostridioides sp. ES-S-0005-03]MCC0710030.1 hypothetical protein [Clostridioides sp. ES-W-0017-02]UDN46013.1 hypothetical protein JJJ25_10605 [Clostridioides sp. ES-S-0173-01]UDN60012.1 hypothetical pro